MYHLKDDVHRYSEIKKTDITDKMLAQKLKELETDGLINRKVYPVVLPKTEYSMTQLGKTIIPILNAIWRISK